jgi:hypothetical protein
VEESIATSEAASSCEHNSLYWVDSLVRIWGNKFDMSSAQCKQKRNR